MLGFLRQPNLPRYDSRNRLIQAGTTGYRYDAENQRIGVDSTNFVVNSQPALSQVLVKKEAGNKTFYVYGLGLIGEEKNGEYKSYYFDFRGSTVALSDAAGVVAERFQYGPYGELVAGNASVTPFLFNGMYGVMTDGNGLYYMRARFYSAEIKRFLNRDVLLGSVGEGQSLNKFSFVTGKPISYIDPFGLVEYCGQCSSGSTDCLLYGGNLCSEQPSDKNIPTIYTGATGTDKIHFIIVGGSATAGLIIDPMRLKACWATTACGAMGPGMFAGVGLGAPIGVSLGDIEDNLSGWSIVFSGDIGFGGAAGVELGCGINDDGFTSFGGTRGIGNLGGGYGGQASIAICYTNIVECGDYEEILRKYQY